MLSCTVHLGERERNIIFGSRNIMFGWRNLHMLSLITLYIPRTFHIPLSPTPHSSPCARAADLYGAADVMIRGGQDLLGRLPHPSLTATQGEMDFNLNLSLHFSKPDCVTKQASLACRFPQGPAHAGITKLIRI